MTDSPATITNKEIYALQGQFSAKPENYTKPIRVYLDVNGVIQPDVRTLEELEQRFPDAVDIDVLPVASWHEPTKLDRVKFWWDKAVISRLAELSRHPLVDIVWLTDWRVSAPHALDELLEIHSVGYLDWQRKMSDYGQSFKKVAIIEEQEKAPSKFIWIDDRANVPYASHPHIFAEEEHEIEWKFDEEGKPLNVEEKYIDLIPTSQFLNVITKATQGLTMEDMDAIEAWVKENS